MYGSGGLRDTLADGLDTSPGLTSWDFLTDLDDGLAHTSVPSADKTSSASGELLFASGSDFDVNAPALFPNVNRKLTALERKQEKNRLAQKRFRQKKKERSTCTEAQLAETTTQLHNLKLRQRQLEARNVLLEQLANINKQHSLLEGAKLAHNNQEFWQDEAKARLPNFFETAMEGSAVVLHAYDHKQLVTVEEFCTMKVADFAKLYTAYTRKQALCLIEISDKPDSPALGDLQRWSLEVTSIFACFCIANPRIIETLYASRMDDGSLSEPHPDKLCDDLGVAIDYTPCQIRDLLHLRHLFYGRLGQLLRQRQALLDEMPAAGDKTDSTKPKPFRLSYCHASDALGAMTKVADQLQTNGAEESKACMQFSAAFFRGIQTSKQHAISMVHPYPFMLNPAERMEAVARQHKQPSIESLMGPGDLDDLQHAANWQAVDTYLDSLQESNLHDHHPFLRDNLDDAE